MRILKYFYSALILVAFACNQPTKVETKLDASAYEKISSKCADLKNDTLIIYFLDGNCSFCVAKASDLESKLFSKQGNKIVFIAETNNENETVFNFEAAKIKSCIIIDTAKLFKKYLPLNTVTKLRREGIVLSQETY